MTFQTCTYSGICVAVRKREVPACTAPLRLLQQCRQLFQLILTHADGFQIGKTASSSMVSSGCSMSGVLSSNARTAGIAITSAGSIRFTPNAL